MKHLKTYKNNNIKKYTCVKYLNSSSNELEYYIDEIVSVREVIEYIIIYRYYPDKNQFVFIEKEEQMTAQITYKYYMENLLFTSNNLNECLEYLKISIQANKYNL